jgi:uncharacterized protein YeaO (DUF488 family)
MTRPRRYSSPVCYANETGAEQPGRTQPRIRIKRVYEPPERGDGFRVLVDRLWPRGVRKDAGLMDAWARDLAPSNELRKWFGHEPGRWTEFRARYRAELKEHEDELIALKARAAKKPLTLLYAARDPEHNHARVLQEVIGKS